MKTQINIKKLLKIYDPLHSPILYKGQSYLLSMDKLNSYVKNPKKNDILNTTDNEEDNLHKDLALYILHTNEKKHINIDFRENPPAIKGVFEIIKSIYNKEEQILIYLQEDYPENKEYITKNKLTAFTNEDANKIKPAVDQNPFSYENSIIVRENVLNHLNDIKFIIEKIKQIYTEISDEHQRDKEIENLINKAPGEVIQNNEFLDKLFKLEQDGIPIDLVYFHSYLKLDFNNETLKTIVSKHVDSGNMKSLGYVMHTKKQPGAPKTFDLTPLLNHEKTIGYMIATADQKINKYSSNLASQHLHMHQIFPLLSPEHKARKDVGIAYLTNLEANNELYPNNLNEVNQDIFKDTHTFLKHIELILHNIQRYNTDFYKEVMGKIKKPELLMENLETITPAIAKRLAAYLDPAHLNFEDYKKLIQKNSQIYTIDKLKSKFNSIEEKSEIFRILMRSNVSLININTEDFKNIFLKNHDENLEIYKLVYIIKKGLNSSGDRLYENPEDVKFFNQKYIKLEYTYFLQDEKREQQKYRYGLFYDTKTRKKMMSKINTYDEFNSLMDKIAKIDIENDVGILEIYQELPDKLRLDPNVIKKLIDVSYDWRFNFSTIDEKLQFNKDVAMMFINKSTADIQHIPNMMFYNKEFMLEFTKRLDAELGLIKRSPSFIQSFFESNDVTSNFHSFFNSYAKSQELSDSIIDKNKIQEKTKKLKI